MFVTDYLAIYLFIFTESCPMNKQIFSQSELRSGMMIKWTLYHKNPDPVSLKSFVVQLETLGVPGVPRSHCNTVP